MITSNQYAVSKQTIQNKHIKINLLNFQYQNVAELSGNILNGSISIDANSDIRRTCNVEFVVTDKNFEIGENNYIWLDKYIQIFIGIDNILNGTIEWFNQGMYIIDAPSYSYDAISNTLSFTGLDLMAKMTGQRNGYLEAVTTIVPQGSNVRNAIIQTITQLGGFSKYVVEECVLRNGNLQPVPNDIVMEQGATIYDLLVALRDIMPYYEIFFDTDGVFHYSQIPTGENEAVIADDDIFTNILISENTAVDFASVKNSIAVYGKDIEANYYATSVEITTQTEYPEYDIAINLVVPDYIFDGSSPNYLYFAFTPTQNVVDKYAELTINDEMVLPVYDYTSGILTFGYDYTKLSLEAGKTYMVTINVPDPNATGTIGVWWLYPYAQFYALVEDTNPESPFYIGKPLGKIFKPLYGGEYDNIVGNELCYERAKYELYLATNMQNTLTLECVPVYYFEVNQLINHAIKDTQQQLPYIIKNINIGLGVNDTMTITAIRYYPLYPSL